MKKLQIALIVFSLFPGMEIGVHAAPATPTPPPVCPPALPDGTATVCQVPGQNRLVYIASGGTTNTDIPLLFLTGGPGSNNVSSYDHIDTLAVALNRTIIMPGLWQGDDSSFGGLVCPDSNGTTPWGIAATPGNAELTSRATQQKALDHCLAQIKLTPASLAAVSTKQSVDDLIALRRALGISRWDVMGESYGGRLAMTLATADSAALRKLVLDSPETPWAAGFWDIGGALNASLTALTQICRKDRHCPARKLDLAKALPARLHAAANATTAATPIRNRTTGTIDAYARMTAVQMLVRVFTALEDPGSAGTLPFIMQADQPAEMKRRFGMLMEHYLNTGRNNLVFGIYHGVRCQELPLDTWYQALKDGQARYPDLAPLLDYVGWRQHYICARLGIPPASTLTAPDLGGMPTLVLSGVLDPTTSPAAQAQAFPARFGLTRRLYSATGHIVHRQRPCALEDIRRFLDGAASDTGTCTKKDLTITFYTPVRVR